MAIRPDTNTLRTEFMYDSSGNVVGSTKILTGSSGDLLLVPGQYAEPAPFGSYKANNNLFPKDVVQLDVYNDQDFYFETINDATSYRVSGDLVTIDLETELTNVGYESGDFRVSIRPLRHYLGSPDGIKLVVQDVSADRLEARLVPSLLPVQGDQETATQIDIANRRFVDHFSSGFFTLEKQSVLSNLYLFLSPTTAIAVNDYIQDRFTIRNSPYSIIFKLNEPLPVTTNVGSVVWISQELNPPVTEPALIIPKVRGRRLRYIKGPNFEVIRKESAVTETAHRSWDDILSNPQTAAQTTRTLFSQSFTEGMQLNVDYRQFENFVKFSNATDRIENFNYKVGLIENYYNLSSSLASTNASESIYIQAQIEDTLAKADNIIGNFDGFERYMYFESSSYVSNSFGEFLDMAWPKATSTKPYQLYSVTSSQVESWLEGIIGSASLHDNVNTYALRKNVPEHIIQQQDGLVDSFVNMLGHFYDIQYEYINQLPKIYDRQESLTEGFAKELVYHIGASLGVNFGNGDDFEDLWSYTLGLNTSGSFNSTNPLKLTGEDRTREVWKRIINNLPLLLRTKGTERGIRALINCYGIPSTILRIREFGGPEIDFDKASQFRHDRFNYMTQVGISGSNFQYISIPYKALKQNGSLPYSVEWRMQMAPNQTGSQVLAKIGTATITAVNGNAIQFSIGASSTTFTSSIYDGTPHSFVLRKNSTNNRSFLYVSKISHGTVVTTTSGLVAIPAGTVTYIPSDTSTNPFSGSVHDIRYWTEILSDRMIEAHALSPTSFFNDESTSLTGGTGSFDQLAFRLTAGADNKRYDYTTLTSVTSSHPDRSVLTFNDGSSLTATFVNFTNPSSSIPVEETHYMEWPDIAGNRQVSNKVRLESTIATSKQLFPNNKTVTSLQDLQPTDSPRLGIYLSPTDEINQDIAEQFGGISLDDYIGAYEDIYNEDYPKLKHLKTFYFKKAQGRYKSQNYIRLLQYYNGSLFTLIKKLVPHRANLQTGLVIEPDILTRSKVRTIRRPQYEDEYYEGYLELPTRTDYATGEITLIQSDTDPFTTSVDKGISIVPDDNVTADTLIVDPGIIETHKETDLIGEGDLTWTGVVDDTERIVTPTGEYLECEVGEIDANTTAYYADKTKGTQYKFFTWVGPVSNPTQYDYATPQKGTLPVSNSANFIYVPAVDDAYSNPIGLVVRTNRRSQVMSPGDLVYKQGGDILRGEAFSTRRTENEDYFYTGSYGQLPIAKLGIRFDGSNSTSFFGSRAWKWAPEFLGPGTEGGLFTYGGSGGSGFTIPLPYNEAPNITYQVSFKSLSATSITCLVQFGSGSSTYQFTPTLLQFETAVITSKASNGLLYISSPLDGTSVTLTNIKVSMLNFPGQFQDYMVGPQASLGLRNQKYNGCKLTAPDFNEDSPDTIDGGPVVTITEGPSTTLIVKPTIDGTYEFK